MRSTTSAGSAARSRSSRTAAGGSPTSTNADPAFEAVEIPPQEFEALWEARRQAVVMTALPLDPGETIDASIRFVEAIFGSLEPGAGLPGDDVTAAETRLGVSLPEGLRELYRRTGRMSSLHGAHSTLVPPEELEFGNGHLIFYAENQGVVAWGIARSRLAEPNPPVDQGQPPHGDTNAWVFYPEFVSLSEFIRAQAGRARGPAFCRHEEARLGRCSRGSWCPRVSAHGNAGVARGDRGRGRPR